MINKPHILAIPYPAQGHVIPLMELCLCLAKNGCKVTFVNTEFNHNRIVKAMADSDDDANTDVSLVSVPDGLATDEDRNDVAKQAHAQFEVVPRKLEALIREINESDDVGSRFCCVIPGENFGWAFDIAKRSVAFWSAAAASLATVFSIPKFIDDGIVGPYGEILEKQSIQLMPLMPTISSTDLVWSCFSDPKLQRIVFNTMVQNNELVKSAEWLICNTAQEMENGVFSLYPKMVPIGPLLANNRLAKQSGSFWREDTDCLEWLDQQPRHSVIYVAFGSFTIFNREEFQELAHGLELTNRPFLWGYCLKSR